MSYRFDFMGRRRIFYVVSAALLVLAVVGFFVRGLNLGIDFTSGTQLTATFQKSVTLTQVNKALAEAKIPDSVTQYVGTGKKQVLISMPSLSQAQKTTVANDITKTVGKFTYTNFTTVSGTFSGQVVRGGILAVILASIGIILYMMIRFDLRFALAGILAVFWDAFVAIGLVALIHFKVNTPFVAGVLTIIGYSINDRIIIFDRIRENLPKRQKDNLGEIVNLSLNQTLGRSINTATVVVLAMLAILILGGDTTKDLAATVVIGVVFGAYSSILLASPIWFDWVRRVEAAQAERRRVRREGAPAEPAGPVDEATARQQRMREREARRAEREASAEAQTSAAEAGPGPSPGAPAPPPARPKPRTKGRGGSKSKRKRKRR